MLATVAAWITDAIAAGGYAGVVALMALESACFPLPSEIIMPFAGYLSSTGRFSLWGVALAGAIGSNIGSTAAYWAGLWGGRRFVERWGRWVLLDRDDLARTERFFARYGSSAVLIGRVLPVVRTFIGLPAGMARMRQTLFQLYSFVGSLVWCYLLAYIGQRLGKRWDSDPQLREVMHRYDLAVAVAMVAAIGWFLRYKLRRRRN